MRYEAKMITDLFEHLICKNCGNTSKFERLLALFSTYGTDYVCRCQKCGTLFIRPYERQVQL